MTLEQILFFVFFVLMLLMGTVALVRIIRSDLQGKKHLAWFFGAIQLLVYLISFLFFMCSQGSASDMSGGYFFPMVAVMWITLFLMPVYYLLYSYLTSAGKPGWLECVGALAAPVLFCVVGAVVYVSEGMPLYITYHGPFYPMLKVFNTLLFSEVPIFVMLVMLHSYTYREQILSYYSSVNDTDLKAIHRVIVSFLICAMWQFFCLVFSVRGFVESSILGWSLTLSMALAMFILYRALMQIRYVAVPSSPEQDRKELTEEELDRFEEAFRLRDHQIEVEETVRDVQSLLERWTADPNKPYLAPRLTVNDVAEQIGVSAKVLSAYINHRLNMNFNSWLNTCRLREVKYLLRVTDRNLDDIAEICGFADRSVLTRFFTRKEGVSPTDYRRRSAQ